MFQRLELALDKGDRKVEHWANEIGVKTIDFEYENNKDPFLILIRKRIRNCKKIIERHSYKV